MSENLETMHNLIVVSPHKTRICTVRQMLDLTYAIPSNHRNFLLMADNGERYIVAIHNRIQSDENNGKLLRYLRDKCEATKALNLKYIGEI